MEIAHTDPVLCIGSCFSEHIGRRLEQLKFTATVNPFGIVYNPLSIAQVLEKIISEKDFSEKDLFENDGLWHSFAHHGRFSHPDKTTALKNINDALNQARLFLKKCDRIILTPGTAHVFILKKTKKVVANCHKIPGQNFLRKRLTTKEVATPLINVLKKIKKRNPGLEVIATVSPVRHLRDGLPENQRSKATLLLALDAVCNALPYVHYFPSYEIVLDDLRDYRFYEKDLAHPNELAIEYIWEKFEDAFFSKKTKLLCHEIKHITNAAAHRPFHPSSEAHRAFIKKQLDTIGLLEKKFPFLNFEKEKKIFQA